MQTHNSQRLQNDPLLESLVFMTKYYGEPHSADVLTAGLPLLEGRLSLRLFERAATKGGLSARTVTTSLKNISPLLLPCILILDDNSACVLLEIDKEQETAKVMFPATGEGETQLPLAELKALYRGKALYLKPLYRFDKRTPPLIENQSGHWFWSTIRGSFSIYRDVLIASLLINAFAIASPLFVMNVYDRIVPNLAFDSLWVLAIGVTIVFIFDFIMRQLRSYFIDVAGKKSDILLSSKIFSKVMGMRLEARPESTGAFARHLQEFESIREFFTSATVAALVDVPFALLTLTVIWIVAGPMVFIPAAALFLLLLYSFIIQIPLRKSIDEGSRLAAQKYANLVEGLNGIEGIKVNGAEGIYQHRWEEAVAHMANWGIQTRKLSNSVGSLSSFLQQMLTVCLVLFGVYLIADGELSMGGLIAAVMLSGRALGPLSQLSLLITRYSQTKSGLAILENIMAMPNEQEDGRRYIDRPNMQGHIQFREVNFCYPEQNKPVLENISLAINRGEKVAIIGRIGSGKTTLQKLLMGLYQVSAGGIQIDGIDQNQIHPADLRRTIGCVLQETPLFFGSIRDNITLGVPFCADDLILKAARRAGVSQFTDQDSNGLDKQVGENGRLLSGGQRQAVAIARALLLEPNVLIMDEPTSAMDNRSELHIKKQLASLDKQQTLILITHKTSMLDVVDRLIVLDSGKLVADGPKEKVLQALKEGRVTIAGNVSAGVANG